MKTIILGWFAHIWGCQSGYDKTNFSPLAFWRAAFWQTLKIEPTLCLLKPSKGDSWGVQAQQMTGFKHLFNEFQSQGRFLGGSGFIRSIL